MIFSQLMRLEHTAPIHWDPVNQKVIGEDHLEIPIEEALMTLSQFFISHARGAGKTHRWSSSSSRSAVNDSVYPSTAGRSGQHAR